MAQNYIRTLFTDAARAMQAREGSRGSYARMEEGATGAADLLGDKEATFIAARDSFYMASVTDEGWPYVQHRGGPPGFLQILEGNQLGFADYRGNRQYVSATNVVAHPRVSLFLMDYPNKRRLKILGTARVVDLADDSALVTGLITPGYKAAPERAFVIAVVGFDWNCPQHITPRFTETEISAAIQPMAVELNKLRAELAALRVATDPKEQDQ